MKLISLRPANRCGIRTKFTSYCLEFSAKCTRAYSPKWGERETEGEGGFHFKVLKLILLRGGGVGGDIARWQRAFGEKGSGRVHDSKMIERHCRAFASAGELRRCDLFCVSPAHERENLGRKLNLFEFDLNLIGILSISTAAATATLQLCCCCCSRESFGRMSCRINH